MKLMTKELEARFKTVGKQDNNESDTLVVAKFFCPWNNWTWYATEYDPDSRVCFGLVSGFEVELGYFSLDELEEVTGPGGLTIERDRYWSEKPLKEVRLDAENRRQCGAI